MENNNINSKAIITADSDNISVPGHIGTWYVIDNENIMGKEYFLLEHEEYGDEAPSVIVDSTGKLIIDDIYNGFDDLIEYLEDSTAIAEWQKEIPTEVKQNVEAYFMQELPQYEVNEIVKRSNHVDDKHLFMVSAQHKQSLEFAVWTCWNESTKSLNYGHYNLKDEEACYAIVNKHTYYTDSPDIQEKRYFIGHGSSLEAKFDTAKQLNEHFENLPISERHFCRLYDTKKNISVLGCDYAQKCQKWIDEPEKKISKKTNKDYER